MGLFEEKIRMNSSELTEWCLTADRHTEVFLYADWTIEQNTLYKEGIDNMKDVRMRITMEIAIILWTHYKKEIMM